MRRLCSARLVAFALVASVLVAACGGSSGGSGSSSNSSSDASADVAGAKAALATYTGHPTAFPVDQPLKQKMAANATFDYLQCVTPICGLFAQVLPPAAKTMGVKLRVVKAGASADSVQGAMNTIVGNKPTGVVLPAVEPDIINNQLRTLQGDKIPVVSNGIMNHQKYGIDSAMFNTETATRAGTVIADWIVARKGAKANVAFELT